MKSNFFKYALAPLLLCIGIFALSFSRDDAPQDVAYVDSETGQLETFDFLAPGKGKTGYYPITGTYDTLASTTGLTWQLPYILASPWQFEIYYQVKKISGNPTNLKVVLDERTITNGVWSPIDSFSVAGADSTKFHFRLRQPITYGYQYRTRLVKTGAQTQRVRIEYAIKPPNQ